MENSNKAPPSPPPYSGEKKKNDLYAKKRILYDMGNFFDANIEYYVRTDRGGGGLIFWLKKV